MNFREKVYYIIGVLLVVNSSCSDIVDIFPRYVTSMQQLATDISMEIPLKAISFEAVKKDQTSVPSIIELNVWITNAAVRPYTTYRLDSLSRIIGSKVKKNITNINTYEWLNIIYITDDGSTVSDSTGKKAFVFRPSELN